MRKQSNLCLPTRALFGIVLVLALVTLVAWSVKSAKRMGRKLRYSIFYEGRNLTALRLRAEQREEDAQRWIRDVESGKVGWPVEKENPHKTLCIAFVTAERNGKPSTYLPVVLKSTLQDVTPQMGKSLYTVLVARGRTLVSSLMDKFDHVVIQEDQPLRGLNLRHETRDYIAALRACRTFPLVLILQDDAEGTRHAVRAVLRAVRQTDETVRGWFFLKLFYHEFWDGWSTETTHKLVLFCILVAGASFFASRWAIGAFFGGTHRKHSVHVMFLAILVSISLTFLAGWIPAVIGRQHLVPAFYPGLNVNRDSATVAMLYNNRDGSTVDNLILFMDKTQKLTPNEPVDLLIGSYAKRLPVPSFIWSPSLFQHRGLQTSIKHKAGTDDARVRFLKESMTWREDDFA